MGRERRTSNRRVIAIVLTLSGLILAGGVTVAIAEEGAEPEIDLSGQGHQHGLGPSPEDFVNIRRVAPNVVTPPNGPQASTGRFVSECGRNRDGHRNSDNFITSPGVTNAAHHVHDYVGNLSTNGQSTEQSLAAAGTTCQRGDKSAYFWPVLRLQNIPGDDADEDGGGLDGNIGRILTPSSVRLEFRGNPTAKVVAMPPFLRTLTGDARAATSGGANANAKWTCTNHTNRITTKYPRCPRRSDVVRILDHPSCWDGQNSDSANHRTHLVHPDKQTGACPSGFTPVPQLRMTLTYRIPQGAQYAVDAFPEQLHNPATDHADFANMMPDALMRQVVECINGGRRC